MVPRPQSAPTDSNVILDCRDLEKYFGTQGNITKALDGVSFTVTRGEFIGIMGPSGSGKTTLLNCISTIDKATTGHVLIEGNDITTLKPRELARFRRQQLGFVFQDANLLDTLTIRENIALSLSINGDKDIDSKVDSIAGKLGISTILDHFPSQVSGGQRQRAAAARAIVTHPSLILADEPTGALDSKNSRILLEAFQTLNEDLGATLVMVTHDAYAASWAHRIIFIKDGKIFNQIYRGSKSRAEFFDDIMAVVSFLGGDNADVH